ncbi:MAG TPA: hypothetical protein VLW85_25820 [Myxococcales bacterium]|nr:hypothetical protein [Myxococcales bacterium]
MRRIILIGLLAAACSSPGVAPGLDLYTCDGGVCPSPGVIQGSVVYAGTARGDAILLLFDTAALPPPDGTGSSAVAVGRVPEATLFAGAAAGSSGPFSAPFSFAQVPAGRSYQIRALIDSKHEFDPFFDFTQSPRAGEPIGGYGEIGSDGQPHLLAIPVAPGQTVSGINVALVQTAVYDPPAFTIAGAPALDQNMDQPVRLRLRSTNPGVTSATFANAHFGAEFSAGGKSTAGDGLPDVFPEVFLHQIRDANGAAVADGAIIPCRAIATSILPALQALKPGDTPIAQDTLDVFVEPLAVDGNLQPLPQIPLGAYQVVVVERTGQTWTVPNSLGDPARKGTPFYDATQGQTISVTASTLPPGGIGGNVQVPAGVTSGNIIVQAYADDPQNPPPPVGAALPVRVQAIPGGGTGNVPYQIDGLPPGKYIVQALADADGNFSPLALLQTPSKGDLVGAVIDTSTLLPKSISVAGSVVTGQDVSMAAPLQLDPPAFTIDAAAAQMPADQVTPIRFTVRATPFSFPVGQVDAPHFAVQLIRNSGGAAVDADQDGLPDVWPRVFLVRLDPDDASGLTQYVSPDTHATATQVIPAAVDPTPFLPALQPQAGGNAPPVITDQLSIVVRPTLLDVTNPAAPRRSAPQPGPYKVVLILQTGEVWQIPNEGGSAALDPQVVCAAGAPVCAPGTVKTQSQSEAFQVGVPAHPIYSGAISGTLTAASPGTAYVFAYPVNAQPPFGSPASADVHLAAEFQSGKVTYAMPDLPTGDYVVLAIVDTRGDFAGTPAFLALAPGAGDLAAAPQVVHVGTAPVSVNLTAASPLPPRPSFEFVDSTGATALTSDVNITLGGSSATLKIKPQAILGSGVAAIDPDAANSGAFVLACPSGTPVASTLSLELVKMDDAAGLFPDIDANGKGTVVPASLDQAQFSSATCTAGGVYAVTTAVSVTVQDLSVKVSLLDPSDTGVPGALVPGRYALFAGSLANQVWRVPNELQPALMDPGALAATPSGVKSLLQTQAVGVNLAP